MHVLVHIDLDQGLGPIGAWGYRNGKLRHFYPESLDIHIPARARDLMAQRTLDVTVPDWMEFIADAVPKGADQYATVIVNDTDSLPKVLAEYRRIWNEPTDPSD
jgi:hypothetical protein